MIENYIEKSNTLLLKKVRKQKKHILKVTHYENSGAYFITQVVYRFSWQYVKRYDNVNIFESEEYSWLVNGYKLRNTISRGVDVHYKEYSEKDKPAKDKSETVSIADEIYISLPEAHYVLDDSDKEFFRMRNISYNNLGGVRWIQNQNRPALYIDSIDTTSRFDGNSIYIHINIKKVTENLSKDISIINGAVYSNRNQTIGNFIGHWFSYTMMLYYINVSHGWKFEDIDYDLLWNLGMYILSFAKPFVDTDWMKGVKLSYVRFLFERRAYNELSKGVKHYYRSLAASKLVNKVTRYSFPSEMNKVNRELFKQDFPKPKTEHQLVLEGRNKQIIELKNKGYSERTIANLLDINRSTIHKVLSNL